MKKNEIKMLRKQIEKALGGDFDKFDFEAEIDRELSYMENKRILMEKISPLIEKKYTEAKAEYDSQKEKADMENAKLIAEEIERHNKDIFSDQSKDLDMIYEPMDRAVKKVCLGFSNSAFIRGRGGLGKTFRIETILRELVPDNHKMVNGDISEAYLYRILYENNGKIIYFTDVARLLSGLKGIDILKCATETTKYRVINKLNYSKKQQDLPDEFIFTGGLIFDFNSLGGLRFRDDFQALITRGDFVDFVLSPEEITFIMRKVAKTNEQKEVTEFLISNYKNYRQFNLRTQHNAFKTKEYADFCKLEWQKEIGKEISQNSSEIFRALYGFMGKQWIRQRELIKYMIETGYCQTIRTAERKISEWIELEELYIDGQNYNRHLSLFASLNEKPILVIE